MTNFEKIKNMSVEELADKISWLIDGCDDCPISEFCDCYFDICSGTWREWLESEAEE